MSIIISSLIITFALLFGFSICDYIRNIFNIIIDYIKYEYDYYKIKKNGFEKNNTYIVGFPSGEIIFVKDKQIDFLLDEELIKWMVEYQCYCYLDHEQRFIKKILEW